MAERSIVSGSPVGSEHFMALDGLRGLSVTLVFLFHASRFFGAEEWHHHAVVKFVIDRGLFGVDVFFVLSGFLITGILLKARGATNYYAVFYKRRALRIFPVYYVAVMLTFALVRPGGYPYGWHLQIWYWLNLSNWYAALYAHPVSLTQFWTLAIEEQFYLLWPFLVRSLTTRRLCLICACMLPLQYGLRLLPAVLRFNERFPEFTYRTLFLHSEAIFAGALLALLMRGRQFPPRWLRALRVSVVLFGIATLTSTLEYYRNTRMIYAAQNTLWAVFSSLLIALIVVSPSGWLSRGLSTRVLRKLGRYSYCIYVNHIAVILLCGSFLLHHRVPHPRLFFFPLVGVVFLLSVGIAALSWRWFEEPILSLKRYTMYRVPAS